MYATIMFIILALLILFLILFIVFKKKVKQRPTDYYNLFIIGLIWASIGIPTKNPALIIIGIIFMLSGLVHKKEWKKNRVTWKDLTKEEKKFKTILIVSLSIMVLVGLVVFFITKSSM